MMNQLPTSSLSSESLSPWQARQAAMLYHYASLDYLKQLHALVTRAIDGVVDPLLETAQAQERDKVLFSQQWGTRNTSQNWADNAWPMLKDLQASLAKDIAMRTFDKYKMTATNEKLRGAEQLSMQWLTADEERLYNKTVGEISKHAMNIDDIFGPEPLPRWGDYGFAYVFSDFKVDSPMIPRYRVRDDIFCETGKIPPRTGVYVASELPDAALQFAVSGKDGFHLKEASIFNEVGFDALRWTGREKLWFDQQAMLDFATRSKHQALFANDIRSWGGDLKPGLAPSAVARHAFTTKPALWHFVEEVAGEYEPVELPSSSPTPQHAIRQIGGEACKESGYYFSPSRENSRRHFKTGEPLPRFESQYGETIWQWDPNQSEKGT